LDGEPGCQTQFWKWSNQIPSQSLCDLLSE
jgi:hypothetical protein